MMPPPMEVATAPTTEAPSNRPIDEVTLTTISGKYQLRARARSEGVGEDLSADEIQAMAIPDT